MSRESMAYIVSITNVQHIPDKDRIVVLSNSENNYNVIGSIDLKIGDKCVYFEVDSILPVEERFEFLRKRCYRERLDGFLIKTMKMNGIYSNGLLIKASELGIGFEGLPNGTCVQDKLKVRKYEYDDYYGNSQGRNVNPHKNPYRKNTIPYFVYCINPRFAKLTVLLFGLKKKQNLRFPTHLISKSDQGNLYNNLNRYWNNVNSKCWVSVKMEGCSVTVIYRKDKERKRFFGKNTIETEYYGRNMELRDDQKRYFIANKYSETLEHIYNDTGMALALQGEYCAPDVQKGIYKNGINFYIYKMVDIIRNRILPESEMIRLCTDYGLKTVPYIYKNEYLNGVFTQPTEIQDFTEELYFKPQSGGKITIIQNPSEENIKENGLKRHEGIVISNLTEGWSFKVKSNEYKIETGL